jgi:hypothetical protein
MLLIAPLIGLPLACGPNENKYKNVSPPGGCMGDLILGYSSLVYSSTYPSEHLDSASADSVREVVLRVMERSFSLISSTSSQLERILFGHHLLVRRLAFYQPRTL